MPLLFVATLSAVAAPVAAQGIAPTETRQRVISSLGFSFIPPQGPNWSEKFEKNQITYLKKTDPVVVSFYTGALEGKLRSKLQDKDALVAFVRTKKDQWGNDNRFFNISTSFQMEEKSESCVRYRLAANDRGAKNKGSNPFLLMLVVGRFCVHPQNRANMVDMFYSVRHVPTFDPGKLASEGEAFVQSLTFEKPR